MMIMLLISTAAAMKMITVTKNIVYGSCGKNTRLNVFATEISQFSQSLLGLFNILTIIIITD